MPHGITATDGLAYVGERPWHGLGTLVEGQAMTAAQAIEAAGLDWEVETQPVYTRSAKPRRPWRLGDELYTEIPRRRAVVRQDTQEVFGVVGDQYTPVQNQTACDVLDAVVGTGDATYHSVGSLWGGRRVFFLAKLMGDYELDNGEKLDSYILLDNSHDGRTAMRMRLTTVRVVCHNTLTMATAKQAAWRARHSPSILGRVNEARDLLGLNAAYMARYMDECNRLADEAFSREAMESLTRDLLHLDPAKGLGGQRGHMADSAEGMVSLFERGAGNRGETKWDAFNAVTEFVDHHRTTRSADLDTPDSPVMVEHRRANSWFLPYGEQMRAKAWESLTTTPVN